jgi:hypothetical protein
MSRIINKFLDNYLGDEVVVKKNRWFYYLNSKNGIKILSFRVRDDNSFIMFRDVKLCNTISSWFGLSDDDAMRKIRDWFADKHNINKFSDLNKFIK